MTEYANQEIMSKFNYLKSQYEIETLNKTQSFITEQEINEQEIKSSMINFNHMIHVKVEELRFINNRIQQLSGYKQSIVDMLMEMNKIQDKYIILSEKNTLIGNDLQLELPVHRDLLHLLSGDLRGDYIVNNTMERVKNSLFITKDSYAKNMFDLCEKIDVKIIDENIKLDVINDFISVYKRTLSSFDVDKKIFNKYTCTVCYENEVSMCFIPCGHTFCKKCSEKATQKCFACNGEFTKRTPIYLLGKEEEDDDVVSRFDTNNPTLFGTNYG
jgi:hypothetical protein